MGKPTGFLDVSRQMPATRSVSARLRDWNEIYHERSDEERRAQGSRCMDCGVPFCQQGCPLGNQIPTWNDLVFRGRWRDAWLHLEATHNFPEFTGRVCPAPCEAACTLSINDAAVTIEQIEREIVERAFREGWVVARPPRQRSGRHVAIVGSGPAGLAAAAQLNRAGHRVTVFERSEGVGGLLRYGIPDFKLEKWVIDRRVELMKDEGIQFVTGADVGGRLSWRTVQQRHDAVLVAIGAGRPRDLEIPGRELGGVHFAMDFLTQQNQRNAGEAVSATPIDASGKRVVILGGGDTGSDCLGTSLRQGATSVRQIELMPRAPSERGAGNPWPQWPLVFRTSSSQQEGGQRDFALLTKRLSGADGRVTTLHAVGVEVRPGAGLTEVAGSEIEIPVDLLILAMGFVGPDTSTLVDQLGVELTERGNVAVDHAFATNVDGVFGAGDAQRGQSLVVWAISDGREAARAVDSYLGSGRPTPLPSRGIDQPFGGR